MTTDVTSRVVSFQNCPTLGVAGLAVTLAMVDRVATSWAIACEFDPIVPGSSVIDHSLGLSFCPFFLYLIQEIGAVCPMMQLIDQSCLVVDLDPDSLPRSAAGIARGDD